MRTPSWQHPLQPGLVHICAPEPEPYGLNGAEEVLQRKVRELLPQPVDIYWGGQTKDIHLTNYTEKLSEELYKLKIKQHIKYLPLREILEKRSFPT